jgi:hypothetical protein
VKRIELGWTMIVPDSYPKEGWVGKFRSGVQAFKSSYIQLSPASCRRSISAMLTLMVS